MCPVFTAPVLARSNAPSPRQRFHGHEKLCHAVAHVFTVHSLALARRHRDGIPDLADPLLARFNHANNGMIRIAGAFVHPQDASIAAMRAASRSGGIFRQRFG